ncbi:MAG: OadG family protein [Candidatus Thermoplasmatota archaeon]|nr:OadG family protein [Candidatus Thermoplasmatota archaeon]
MTHFLSSHRPGFTIALIFTITLASMFIFLNGPAEGLPDLQLSASQISLEDGSVYIDEMVVINVTLINIGSDDLYNVSVGVYDDDPLDGGKLLCPEKRVDVGHYNFTMVNFTFKAKDEHRKVRTLWIAADVENEVNELNENNNIGTVPLRVMLKETIGFVLTVVGRGILLTFSSLSILALVVYAVGYVINRFFAEKEKEGDENEDEDEGSGPELQMSPVDDNKEREEIAAASAAVTAYRRGV